MARNPVIGVMGPGAGARREDLENAGLLGKLIAEAGWVLLSGGRAEGVMGAVNRGAAAAGGLTVGVIPSGDPDDAAPEVAIAIATGLGSARNNVNVLSSDVVIACGIGLGTVSEIALALKAGRPVVMLGCGERATGLFDDLAPSWITAVDTPEQAVDAARGRLV